MGLISLLGPAGRNTAQFPIAGHLRGAMPCNQPRRKNLKKTILLAWTACTGLWPAFGQVKQTKEQIPFYESQWTGERFPEGAG